MKEVMLLIGAVLIGLAVGTAYIMGLVIMANWLEDGGIPLPLSMLVTVAITGGILLWVAR
jgi:hypothetical protein